ncbi:single-stranded-DNA-specific exonuclease RecJ [Peptostreptococcus anaerobius]|uniref:Single-stranded-DNA-specific exonuclease RecJ n=1 Tax=Peptostreptococcus porci TaxID=2652282 RepID=A0A6N7WY89_9FIRM|nr:single-stranded-DNA-specific exonuclease RecJ [Peptostreptococcus porci]MST61835.1 single-stranded-DNA-specific exonuclease RecJ [Peptostreptococcus porci]
MKKWTLKCKSKPSGNKFTIEKGISDEIAQIMINRSVADDDLDMFLNPSLDFLRNPFLLKDMDKAVERIYSAFSRNEKIFVYGDYDVDGVSSTSIMMIFFDNIGYKNVDYYIPNRLEEGYGLNTDAIDYLKENNADLIITVDCGITSVNEVEYAREKGIDVIITDHHECQEKLPNAVAVIDHKRPDCDYPFKGLCGCGIAFKLIHALSGDDFYKDIYKYLEIVSLATICDMMPVLDENRIIVKNGFEIIGKGENLGMKALIEVCGLVDTKINSSHLGFALGPRINASGRLGFSNLGVKLFTTKDTEEAKQIAEIMDINNSKRQEIESDIFFKAEELIEKNSSKDDKVLVLASEGWHHGIIGIVASKITEKYYKPCVLLCIEDGMAVGSARSIKGFDLFSALFQCKEFMVKFGGHEQAAGMTVREEDIENLRVKLNHVADYSLSNEDLIEEIKIEYEISEDSLNLEFVDSLHDLEPFGINNPTPYFLIRDCIVKSRYLIGKDKNHLKIGIEKGKSFECVGFGMAHLSELFEVGDSIDLVFKADKNTFNGNTKVQLLIKDIRLNKTKSVYKHTNFFGEYANNVLSYCERVINDNNSDCANSHYPDLERHSSIVDSIVNRKNKRVENIAELFDGKNLFIINTLNGMFRLFSDINILNNEKIEFIFISNIDKRDIKGYNKIIMYDYPNNLDEVYYLLKEKDENTDIIMNVNESDFVHLMRKFSNMKFDRNKFVKIYKYLNNLSIGEINIGELVENTGVPVISVLLIINILKTEDLIDFNIDLENGTINFKILPKPEKKVNLEENVIVKKISSDLDGFIKMYGLD